VRRRALAGLVVLAAFAAATPAASRPGAAAPHGYVAADHGEGELRSPSGARVARIDDVDGSRLRLSLPGRHGRAIEDVTGVAWLAEDSLVFSVSPLFGTPGVFLCEVSRGRVTTLVHPSSFTRAFPDGADYFEVVAVRRGAAARIVFRHAADVDRMDFGSYWTASNLREVDAAGGHEAPVDPGRLPAALRAAEEAATRAPRDAAP